MTKFAKLARWIISIQAEPPGIEDMIGSYPEYGKKESLEMEEQEEQEYELNENELHWVDWAEENGYTVQKTAKGIKIVK